jgi:carbamoyl-phosphate synthase large subunit
MDKTIILISSIGGDIGCSAVRSLRDSVDVIIGCDIVDNTFPVSDIIDKFYKVPPASDTENYINFLKEIISKEKIEGFLPISEPEIEVLNSRRKEFDDLGIRLLMNNHKILDNFLDKLKTVYYLESINVRVPKTMLLSDYNGGFGYPVIVKPKKGCGSKRLWIVQDPNDLEYIHLKDDGSLIVQEYIGTDAEDYTTGVFSDGNVVSSISFKRKLGFGSLSIEASLVNEPFLDSMAQHISKDVGLKGSINIQSRRSGDVFIPYEINPRLSSTMLFRKKFGFDDAVWWLNVLFGKGYSYKVKYKSGRAIRYLSECYFDIEAVET